MQHVAMPMVGAVVGTLVAWAAMPWTSRIADAVIPASRWLEVRALAVENARMGDSPLVRIDRTIRQAFSGDWTVTLRQVREDGTAVFCTRQGQHDYRADTVVPENTDLDWWMNIPANPPCPDLPAGRYDVTIVWALEIPGLPPKAVRVQSNVFEVTP